MQHLYPFEFGTNYKALRPGIQGLHVSSWQRANLQSSQTCLMVKSNVGFLRNIQQKKRSPLVSIVSGSLLVNMDSVRGFHLRSVMLQATNALGMTGYRVICH